MKKTVFLTTFMLLALGMAAGTTDYQGPKDKAHIMDAPGDQKPVDQAPDNPGNKSISLPDLPSQASDTAKKVLDTVGDFLSGSIENLGKTLSNILGG